MKCEERFKAIILRRRGYSLKEIAEELRVSKSSVSLWVRDVALSKKAKDKLLQTIKIGQFVSAERKKEQTRALEQRYFQEAGKEIKERPNFEKVLCAMIFWCEGTKNVHGGVAFTNSDPQLVATFLKLLRKNFTINELKFRPCIHLHSYHSNKRQLDFWSKVTNINKSQFIKPYRKPNSGKRIHEHYEGCVSIKYHSTDLARRLTGIAKAFMAITGA